jgi:hypothetical protein
VENTFYPVSKEKQRTKIKVTKKTTTCDNVLEKHRKKFFGRILQL